MGGVVARKGAVLNRGVRIGLVGKVMLRERRELPV